tara:strand:- start:2897 stop:8239 length:5343 start_codon:yes stop_codon:yes gene_type:complete
MKYVSGRVKELKVGISNYSEDKFSLDIVGIVTAGSYRTGSSNLHSDGAELKNLNVSGVSTFAGNVAIGTDNVYDPVGASNTTILAVGILTANTIYSTLYGQFTGGSVVANNIVGSGLSISGISTLGSVQVSSGIITATSGIVTYFGDGSKLTGVGNTANIRTNSLKVLGISTFTGDLDVDGNIIGDNATNISGINSVTATNFFGPLTGNVTGNLTGNADTATSSATVTNAAQPNITSLGSLTGLNVVGVATIGGDIKANGNIVGDNSTNITGIAGVTATTLAGTLQTAAQPNVTSLGTLTSLNVTGDVSIGGTLTYDDVTNIDSVGLITARSGVRVSAGGLTVTGVSTFNDNVNLPDNKKIQLGDNGDLQLYHNGTHSYIKEFGPGGLFLDASQVTIGSTDNLKVSIQANPDTHTALYYNNSQKIRTTGVGITVFGTTQTQTLNVSGLSTFTGDVDANGSLTVLGSVGIGTTDPNATVNSNNTSKLAVGILTARQIFSTLYGQFTGGSVLAENIVGTALSISGISTLGGNVAIGTDNVTDPVGAGNTAILAVGILTARRIFSSLHGEFTGGSVIASNIVGSALSVSGISTIGIVQISSGIITATSGIVTYFGDGSNLTGVSGISTAGTSNFEKIVVNDLVVGSGASVVGIVTASAFAGFKYLQAPFGSTTTFTVTVASKDATHRYNGTGSSNAYLINGVQAPVLTLTPGRTYRFTNDNTGSHPLKFYYEADKTTLYTTGVNFQNTYTEISVSDTTPNVLHYQCTAHAYMGNAVVTNSNVVDTPYVATLRKGLNVTSGVSTFVSGVGIGGVLLVTGDITANGNIVGDNATNITGIAGVTASTLTGTLQTAAQPNVTSLGTLTSLNVTGDVSIGGTLTYDDVTNIDSVGLITARSGINVTGGGLNVVGVSTFAGNINANGNIVGDNATNISGISSVTATTYYGDGSSLTGIGASGFSPDGQENLYAGTGAGAASDSDTCYNIALGSNAGNDLNSGDCNIFLGTNAGAKATGSGQNIAIGLNAMCEAVGGSSRNTMIGNEAGRDMNGGSDNVFLGSYAGLRVTNPNSNVAIGKYAGACPQTGQANVYIGNSAGFGVGCLGDGSYNVGLGNFALYAVQGGDCNVAMGYCAATCLTSGSYNITLGTNSGKKLTTGSDNIALGQNAMSAGTVTGNNNISFGYNAGCSIVGGIGNINIGKGTGKILTNGGYNTFFGWYAGASNYGNKNVAIGCYAGVHADGGLSDNVFLGTYAGCCAKANRNIALGYQALKVSTSGGCNVVLGDTAACAVTSGCFNLVSGFKAGLCISSGSCNIFLGKCAGNTTTTGDRNIAIGHDVELSSATGSDQLAIGSGSNNWIVGNANFNVGIGTTNPDPAVGVGNTAKLSVGIVSAYQFYGDGSNLTGVGFNADAQENLYAGTSSGAASDADTCFNIGIGYSALNSVNSGDENIAIGKCAGNNVTSGIYNIFIGKDAGRGNSTNYVTGTRNTVVGGEYAGYSITSGSSNTLLGSRAGLFLTSGSNNTFVGRYAGGATAVTGANNTALGHCAGKRITSGTCNTALGQNALGGSGNVTGHRNLALGSCAGNTITSGCCNIAIGYDVEVPSATGSDQLAIGSGTNRWITGNANFNVGIGTNFPDAAVGAGNTAKLSVGIVSAYQLYGDGSALTGIGLTSGAVTDQTGISTSIGTFNVSAGISTNIDSFAYSSNNYKTAEYTIHFMNGSNTQAQKLLVMQDGVTAFSNEFAVMSSSSLLVSVGATVSGSNVLVQATPETGVSGVTTFRWRREVQD